jgi:hypothetical protein
LKLYFNIRALGTSQNGLTKTAPGGWSESTFQIRLAGKCYLTHRVLYLHMFDVEMEHAMETYSEMLNYAVARWCCETGSATLAR